MSSHVNIALSLYTHYLELLAIKLAANVKDQCSAKACLAKEEAFQSSLHGVIIRC